MEIFKLLITIISLFLVKDENPVVLTKLGFIEGKILKSRSGNEYSAFRGVPYAKPPIGENRFKDSQPVEPWAGVYDATYDGPACPQPDETFISENCLILNVYTQNPYRKQRRPVLVYIHGGSFWLGSGSSSELGPDYIMDHDVVLVTINYRLGIFGFLSTGTKEYPGNAGMKDQVLALKWVRDNIESFAGDPNLVTIWGHSAGSMSVSLLLVSPMSQGLFHRAIAMSAVATSPWEYKDNMLKFTKSQAKILNCTTAPLEEMINCLKNTTALDLAESNLKLLDYFGFPLLTYIPVVERDFGQERFLIEDPVKTILNGNFTKVPIITGVTLNEFDNAALDYLNSNDSRELLLNFFDVSAPNIFVFDENLEATQVFKNYLNITEPQPGVLELDTRRFQDLLSDGVINFGEYRFAQLFSPHTDLYYYLNTYLPIETNKTDVAHGDDMCFLFHKPSHSALINKTGADNTHLERMVRMWMNFAEFGTPNNPADEYLKDINWVLYKKDEKKYLEIGRNFIMKEKLFQDRMEIWEQVFPLSERFANNDRYNSRDHDAFMLINFW